MQAVGSQHHQDPNPKAGGNDVAAQAARQAAADKAKADKEAKQKQEQEDRKKKREEMQAELTKKLGLKDGKQPCFFHHRPGGKCRYSAADCKLGYH